MTNQYTDIDLRLRRSTSMLIVNDLTKGSIDAQIVPFQFPPVIKSDSKRAKWQENDIASYEPFAVWMGSDARKLDVQVEYVVTTRSNLFAFPDEDPNIIGAPFDGSGGEDVWSVANIINIMRKIKSYFYITIERGLATYPLVKAIFYDYSPRSGDDGLANSLGTWRLLDVNIQPSGALIEDGDNVCHMKHTVTFSMALMTQLINLSGGPAESATKAKEEADLLRLEASKPGISRDRTGVINPWF